MHNEWMQAAVCAARRASWWAAVAIALGTPSCSFPNFDFRATEAPLDATIDAPADTAPVKPSCPGGGAGGDACARIPRFAGVQKVDGSGDELCALSLTTFDKRTAAFNSPDPPPADVDPRVEVRAGWSAEGLHLHVHVIDARVVVVPPEGKVLHFGDSIEVYAAGFVPTAGDYDDKTDVGAVHVIVAPPGPAIGTRAYLYTSRYDFLPAALSPSSFAGRLVDDGYEIELRLPWTLLTRGTFPKAGESIGFDLSVNAKDDPSRPQRSLQSTLGYRTVAVPAESCTEVTPAQPYCDDRTWCVPMLD
jgi:hypothetical protein